MALDPVTAALDLGRTALERFFPDRDAKERRELEGLLATIEAAHESSMAQAAVNKIEAGHRTVFVAGWRPAIGWTGAIALAYASILQPLFVSFGVDVPPPTFIETNLMEIVAAMLGIGGFRTYEKMKGVAR